MAFDGTTLSCVVNELREKALGGKIEKIYQPEKDEITIIIKKRGEARKLVLTASASHPRAHFTSEAKINPTDAPLFCMVMRKRFSGGLITDIVQPNFERILIIGAESFNEMGDLTRKNIIIEIMGKHSNIILTDENDVIIDAIKRVSHETSSVREVLPGKRYVAPPDQGKCDPTRADAEGFVKKALRADMPAARFIYKTYSGISPVLADEICFRAGVGSTDAMSGENAETLAGAFEALFKGIESKKYDCGVFFDASGLPVEFSCVSMTVLSSLRKQSFESASETLDSFFAEKDGVSRMKQKTTDIRRVIQLNAERCAKKRDLYERTLKSVADREASRLKGELLTANIYAVKKGMTAFTAVNFYDESAPEVVISLDPTLNPQENAQRYFKKCAKDKRAYAAAIERSAENEEEARYIESLAAMLRTCVEGRDEAAVDDLKEEMADAGYIKKPKNRKNIKPRKSEPMRFTSPDGFDIYVGKNNRQNDELTMRFAAKNDLWFHTKDIPGSHVIVRSGGADVPEATLLRAAELAAWFSKGRAGSGVPVDYTARMNVKKPNGAKPGMVIYDNYRTIYITPDESAGFFKDESR
ncbi:MAG: NFACT family protein [Clostridiales bacterium]|jgi:predicted ribosome quality control (RQC) complex YloA/Tae2 family protein|nr:NFACT family protein [Clostridiales bacterium]